MNLAQKCQNLQPFSTFSHPSKPLPDRSAINRFWASQAAYYQALGIRQFCAGEQSPFPVWSFAAIHWRKGVTSVIKTEIAGGVE